MEKKRIVIALGGNALGKNLHEQMLAVKDTAKAIVDLVGEGHEVVISHGNGPQVGMIQKAMDALVKKRTPIWQSAIIRMRSHESRLYWLRFTKCIKRDIA